MVKPDVPMVLFDSGLDGTSGLSNVDLATFAGGCCIRRVF